jgi:two-component system, OmpR family, sensor kinase
MNRLSIRARITGGSLLIAIVVAVVAGIIIDSQVERIVHEGTVAVLESDSEPYVVALRDQPGSDFDAPGPSQHVAVVAPDGTTSLDTLPKGLREQRSELVTDRAPSTETVDGTTYVVLSRTVEVDGEDWHVIAARNATEESTVLGQMRLLVIGGLALVLVGVGVSAWWLTTASLAPVGRMRRSAEQLSAAPSGELLPVGPPEDEIAQLARTLNELIARLRAASQRERQLVSDASHELRTPLAILSARLQLAAAEGSTPDDVRADLAGARRDVARLSSLVASLLDLSAIEAGDRPAATATARDLEREAVEASDRARFRLTGTEVDVRYDGLGEAVGATTFGIDAEDFGRLIDNLTGNAMQAMGASGALGIRLERTPGGVRLTVSDTGGGLDPEFAPHAFERFSRSDASRSTGSGVGLGLAITDAIVRHAGGTVRLDNSPGVGLAVIVELPAVDAR